MARSDLGTIRIATPLDAPGIASVHVASWRETYAGMVPDAQLSSLSARGRTAMWDQILRQPAQLGSTTVHVVECSGETIAFGSCGVQRSENLKRDGYGAEISALYVLQAFQRRGIGVRLLVAMASDLLGRGFSAASLWVLSDNLAARAFYERYGAQLIAERQDVCDGAVLSEVAYGWSHLTYLTRAMHDD